MIMLVNFALESLNTQISCDKVSADGYEPQSLLNPTGQNSKGFMVERFICPPVSLKFYFQCAVSISHVVIHPQVGNQRSSSFQIWSAPHSKRYTHCDHNIHGIEFDALCGETNSVGSVLTADPIFRKVGSICRCKPGSILFENHFYQTNTLGRNYHTTQYVHHSELRHHQKFTLSAAGTLIVRILCTADGGIAAIRNIEIWGEPAHFYTSKIKENIFKAYLSVINTNKSNLTASTFSHQNAKYGTCQPLGSVQHFLDPAHQKTSTHSIEADRNGMDLDIPGEFIDKITCEIMSNPMLLPCGLSVDLSTIEKFSDVESTYGRQPSDPFTGLTYTQSRHPIVNASLKLAIDNFLSHHADHVSLWNVPRISGHSRANCATSRTPGLSHLIKDSRVLISSESSKGNIQKNELKNIRCMKSKCVNLSSVGNGDNSCDKKMQLHDNMNVLCQSNSISNNDICLSHEENLRVNLKNSLSCILGKLPSFSTKDNANFPRVLNSTDFLRCCGICTRNLHKRKAEVIFESINDFYQLECRHLICRQCLLDVSHSDEILCYVCCKLTKKCEIVHIHL